MFSGIKLESTVPNIATNVKKNKVAETKPIEKTINSFFSNLSSIIFVVNTKTKKTIVIGLDKVNINPCIKIFLEVGFRFNPGIILILKTFKIMLIPNSIKTVAPISLNIFLTFSVLVQFWKNYFIQNKGHFYTLCIMLLKKQWYKPLAYTIVFLLLTLW